MWRTKNSFNSSVTSMLFFNQTHNAGYFPELLWYIESMDGMEFTNMQFVYMYWFTIEHILSTVLFMLHEVTVGVVNVGS